MFLSHNTYPLYIGCVALYRFIDKILFDTTQQKIDYSHTFYEY